MNQKEKLRQQHSAVIEKTVKQLAVAYNKYHGSVTEFLLQALFAEGILQPSFSEAYVKSVLQEYAVALQDEVDRIADTQVEEAFILSLMLFYEDIGSPISRKEAQKQVSATGISYSTKAEVKRLLSLTSSNTSQRINNIVRQSFADSLLYQAASQRQQDRLMELYEQTNSSKQFTELLHKEGFVGIVDSRGHRWKPDVYAKMVLRTKLMESDAQNQRDRGKETGVDLAWISVAHVNNPCNLWEGTIISLNGVDSRFPTYEEAKATGEVFHPNCQHYLNIIRDISLAPLFVITATEQKYGIDLSEYKQL